MPVKKESQKGIFSLVLIFISGIIFYLINLILFDKEGKEIRVGLAQIFSQLKGDLIGKDSFRGVTNSYAWMANQLGHFALGFVPTLIAFTYKTSTSHTSEAKYYMIIDISIIVICMWMIFEIYNFYNQVCKIDVKYDKTNLMLSVSSDTLLDIGFFACGTYYACYNLIHSLPTYEIEKLRFFFLFEEKPVLITFTFLLFAFFYFYRQKMFFDFSNLPKYFRLANYDVKIKKKEEVMKKANGFYSSLSKQDLKDKHHLVIYGGFETGRTSLALGIGTEYAIKKNLVLYFTLVDFLDLISSGHKEDKIFQIEAITFYNLLPKLYNCIISSIRSIIFCSNEKINKNIDLKIASLIIIDNINCQNTIDKTLINSNELMDILKKHTIDKSTYWDFLKSKNVIYVIGNSTRNIAYWENNLNLGKSNIINLEIE